MTQVAVRGLWPQSERAAGSAVFGVMPAETVSPGKVALSSPATKQDVRATRVWLNLPSSSSVVGSTNWAIVHILARMWDETELAKTLRSGTFWVENEEALERYASKHPEVLDIIRAIPDDLRDLAVRHDLPQPQPVWLDVLTDPESGASCLLIEFKAADSLEKNIEVLSELRRRHLNPYVTFDFRVIEDV